MPEVKQELRIQLGWDCFPPDHRLPPWQMYSDVYLALMEKHDADMQFIDGRPL